MAGFQTFGRGRIWPFGDTLGRCGVPKEEVLFVCNQLNTDVAGAEGAGIRTVWLSDEAYRSQDDEVCEARPSYSIPTLRELPDLVRRLCEQLDS